jgi:rubrerythrin
MDYNQQIPLVEDEGLKTLLVRIRDHEVYHDEVFSDLLAEVQVEEKEPKVTAEPEPEVEAEPAPEPLPSPLGKLTVGSLLKTERQNKEG